MGYYIETPGQNHDKAQAILDAHGGRRLTGAPASLSQFEGNEAVICVMDNGAFEAAAFCYSEEELAEFARPDGRPKEWLIIDKTRACELTGFS